MRSSVPWHTVRWRDPYADLKGEPIGSMSEFRAHAHPHARADHHINPVGSRPCVAGGACRRGLIAHVHRVSAEDRAEGNVGVGARLRAILRSPSYAVISAENPSGTVLSGPENTARTRLLAENLASMGYRFHAAYGSYVYQEGPAKGQTSHERAFLVEDMNRLAAQAIADRFGQESFVYGGELIAARSGKRMMRFSAAKTVIGPEAAREGAWTTVRIGDREVAFALRP